MDVLFIAIGLALLVVGGQLLVGGASSLARAFRIPPLVIGLTVVAYGTSAPELAVSMQAAFSGTADVAMGNVLGSNICNVLLVLGLAALARPLVVEPQLVRLDVPIMIFVSFAALLMALDGVFSRWNGLWLVAGALLYTLLQIHMGRKNRTEVSESFVEMEGPPPPKNAGGYLLRIGYIIGGLVLLVYGADLLVQGAVNIARAAGVSELVIGLTIVALGTSMPEVAATVIATLKKETAMAVGNVVGSNVFNILAVLGGTAALAPGGVKVATSALSFDFPVMVAVALACFPIFATGHRIARWEGAFFLFYYVAYIGYLVVEATDHHLANEFRAAFWGFVLPITMVTLVVSFYRYYQEKRSRRART